MNKHSILLILLLGMSLIVLNPSTNAKQASTGGLEDSTAILETISSGSPNSGGSVNIEPDSTFTYTLVYLDYAWVYYAAGLTTDWNVVWNFVSSNSFVGIELWAFDQANFAIWDSGGSATGYKLSDGSFYTHSGIWDVVYDNVWYFVFYNSDAVAQTTTITINMDARVTSSIWESSFVGEDLDGDFVDDRAVVTTDPDLPLGITGTVRLDYTFYNGFNQMISTSSLTVTITGNAADSFTVDFTNIAAVHSFYVVVTSTFIPVDQTISWSSVDDTFTTQSIQLGPLGAGFPKINSFYGNTWDNDGDTFDDSVNAVVGPALSARLFASITVEISLYLEGSPDSPVLYQMETFPNYDGSNWDEFQVDLGTVSAEGFYYLSAIMYLTNSPTVTDSSLTNSVYLYPLGFGFSIWYPDTDDDGFGDVNSQGTQASVAPPGHVSDNTDCDDSDADVYPGANELNDGIDNNCNGEIDEGFDMSMWYPDKDGDGYGDAAATGTSSSFAPPNHVSDNTDCDDNDADVYPGANELNDGIDNNCDGTTDEGVGEDTGNPTSDTPNQDERSSSPGSATAPLPFSSWQVLFLTQIFIVLAIGKKRKHEH